MLLRVVALAAAAHALQLQQIAHFEKVQIKSPEAYAPRQEVTVVDLMPHLHRLVKESGMKQGCVNVVSMHTTTAITINEWESRLVRDVRAWLLKLAPPDDRSLMGTDQKIFYKHNDIEVRPDSEDERLRCLENGWNVDDEEELQRWRDQEPINAHSHLGSMLLGSSESIPVVDGALVLGQWQSVMLVDLDGPRDRSVGIQCLGFG